MKYSYVCILASRRNGTLYTGVTSDLIRRVWEHKNDIREGFTSDYGIHTLVWFEVHGDVRDALRREKRIKKWNRAWKLALIEKENPRWLDRYPKLVGETALPAPGSFDLALLRSARRG